MILLDSIISLSLITTYMCFINIELSEMHDCKQQLKITMGYSRKNPHLPDGWDSGNSHWRGGQRLWKSRREGGG